MRHPLMRYRAIFFLFFFLSVLLQAGRLSFPQTEAKNANEHRFGHTIKDPFRWLEVSTTPAVQKWVESQEKLAENYLAAIPKIESLKEIFETVFGATTTSTPILRGTRQFYSKELPGRPQAVLCVRDDKMGRESIFFDPLVDGKGLVLGQWFVSPDGKYLAYALHRNAEVYGELHVRSIENIDDIMPPLPWADYCDLAWRPDGLSFFYTRVSTGPMLSESEKIAGADIAELKIRVGVSSPTLVFPSQHSPEIYLTPMVSEDGRWLFVKIWKGWTGAEIYFRDINRSEKFVSLIKEPTARVDLASGMGRFFILTTANAPNGRILSCKAALKANPSFIEIVPSRKDVALQSMIVVGSRLIISVARNGATELEIFEQDGQPDWTIKFPEPSSLANIQSDKEGAGFYFERDTFDRPKQVYYASIHKKTIRPWFQEAEPLASPNSSELVHFSSSDGTVVSMFVLKGKPEMEKARPFLMRVYGGFGESFEPWFDPLTAILLQQGWGVAIPHLRGGGEYGDDWHQQAVGQNKQRTFDDGIAAAQFLIKTGLASCVSVQGSSNGGLTAGALITQQPTLFSAAVLGVPILDMIRFPLYGEGKSWIGEYGSPDKESDFHALLAYSPYHHVRINQSYPSVLFISAEDDQRVDPMHARKMAAALQATTTDHPVVLHTLRSAGHSGSGQKNEFIQTLRYKVEFLLRESR